MLIDVSLISLLDVLILLFHLRKMTSTETFSKDELHAPDWLNKDFLENTLKNYKKTQKMKLIAFKISPGTNPGEHFASIMFKIDVSYEYNKNSMERSKLILKTVPVEDGVKMDFLRDSSAFTTEMQMYGDILPKMEKVLREKGDTTVFAPELIYQSNHPYPVIILMDMTPDSYKTYEEPVAFESLKVITAKLAKFHACSMVLNENATDVSKLTKSMFEPHPNKPDFAEEWLVPGLKLAIDEVSRWENCDRIVKKLENCLKTFGKQVTKIFLQTNESTYKVLNHGDLHVKNLLQRHGGLKDDDVLMIDFQFSYFNTPATDFASLIYEVGNTQVRELHKDAIIELYYDTFLSTLQLLEFNGQVPMILDFKHEINRCAIYEFSLLVCYSAFHYANFDETDFLETLENKDFFAPVKSTWQNNKEFREFFIRNVNEMIDKRILD